MRIAFIGQQDFGKAVLEAFLARGDEVAGVFCAPEKPGARPDVLKTAAEEKGLTLFQFPSLKSPEAEDAMRGLNADIGIMAYVLQFAPQSLRRPSPRTARSSITRACCRGIAARPRSTGRSPRVTCRPA